MHIRFAYGNSIHHYILDFPMEHVRTDGWPEPRDFYLSTRAIRTGTSWTIAEYDQIYPDWAGATSDDPMHAAPMAGAMNAGGYNGGASTSDTTSPGDPMPAVSMADSTSATAVDGEAMDVEDAVDPTIARSVDAGPIEG